MENKKRHFNFVDHKGEKFKTNEGYVAEIIEYEGSMNCTVKFDDEFETKRSGVNYNNLKTGTVRNFNHRCLYGVGYIGAGKHKSKKNKKNNISYKTWSGIFERSFDKKHNIKHPSYKDVTVCEEWHNFQNFAKWFEENYVEGWQVDKDILFKGNKVYSPKNCAFVPREVNNLFINKKNHRNNLPLGVSKDGNYYRATSTQNKKHVHFGNYKTPEEAFYAYKKGKEKYIKEVADKWKDQIDERVYQAMYNWKIEITD